MHCLLGTVLNTAPFFMNSSDPHNTLMRCDQAHFTDGKADRICTQTISRQSLRWKPPVAFPVVLLHPHAVEGSGDPSDPPS